MRMAQPPGMGGINAPSTLPVVNSYTAPSAAPAFASPIAAPSTVAQPAQISSLPTAAAPTADAYEPGRTPLKTAAELGASPGAIVVRAPKAPKVYTAGMEVMILSDSSGGWVSGTVVGVDPDGTVTVQYGQNQKAIPKEHQATHLSPKSAMGGTTGMSGAPMAPAAALPTTAMPPSAGPTYAAAPANYAAQPATYAAAPQMPQEQGTVRYDLAQIAAINDQVEMSGFTGFQGAPQTYNPAPAPYPYGAAY